MKRSACVLVVAAVVFGSTDALAIRAHRWKSSGPIVSLTPSLGFVSFPEEFEKFTGFDQVSGGMIGFDLGFWVVDGLGIGFEIADVPASESVGMYQRGGDVLFLNFNIFYDFHTETMLNPFLIMGIGRMELQHPYSSWEGYTTASLGGGVKIRFHRNAGVRFTLRHFRTFLNSDYLSSTQFTAGISFIF